MNYTMFDLLRFSEFKIQSPLIGATIVNHILSPKKINECMNYLLSLNGDYSDINSIRAEILKIGGSAKLR